MPPTPDPLRTEPERESRALPPPRPRADRSRWQRLKRLLAPDREDIEQEGLLVERQLPLRPRERDAPTQAGERFRAGVPTARGERR